LLTPRLRGVRRQGEYHPPTQNPPPAHRLQAQLLQALIPGLQNPNRHHQPFDYRQ